MKKLLFSLIISCLICTKLFSQSIISNDGSYVCANINQILVIQSTVNSWKKEIIGAKILSGINAFSRDSKTILYSRNDTLFELELGTNSQTYLAGINISSIKQPKMGNKGWLAYTLKESINTLVIQNLFSGNKYEYKNVADYFFDNEGNGLLIRTESKQNSVFFNELKWVSIPVGNCITIWSSDINDSNKKNTLINYAIDEGGTQVAFIVQEKKQEGLINSIWYYKTGTEKAKVLVNDDAVHGVDKALIIADEPVSFSKKGSKLFFTLREKQLPKPDSNLLKLDVWNYQDSKPQSQQLKDVFPLEYAAVMSIGDCQIMRLERDNELLLRENPSSKLEIQMTDDFALICHWDNDVIAYRANNIGKGTSTMSEANWNKACRPSVYLVSLKNGSRKLLKKDMKMEISAFPYFRFSPDGNYVLYYDREQKNYNSYEIKTGTLRNLTKQIDVSWALENPESRPRDFYNPQGVAKWLTNNTAWIYDHYRDIWQIDPAGLKSPVNITNGFFHKNIKTVGGVGIPFENNMADPSPENGVILAAVNRKAGLHNCLTYYKKTLNKFGGPEVLLDGSSSYLYLDIKKAADKDVFIFQRQSYTEPPSTFFTKDFKTSTRLIISGETDRQRNSKKRITKYRQVITYKTPDGIECFGVLQYPIDFDPKKKYPVIFTYYEDAASSGNSFGFRYVDSNQIKTSTYKGYIDFEPDLHYKIGETGASVYNTIVSAAKYLSKLPFIDPAHMGITGHSFGGYETNLLVAQTGLFAAACAGSGLTDMVSEYGTEEKSRASFYSPMVEEGQLRIGTTLWERPDLYLKNSPVFYADKINTPLLMGIGRKDFTVPVSQGIELFKALRRLGKRAWLISYDDAGHELDDKDWEIRKMQFFDHYLKGLPAPVWMTRGIPARMKGQTLGLELDTTIKTPGLLMDEEIKTPQQKDLLKHRTTVNGEGRIVDVPAVHTRKKQQQ